MKKRHPNTAVWQMSLARRILQILWHVITSSFKVLYMLNNVSGDLIVANAIDTHIRNHRTIVFPHDYPNMKLEKKIPSRRFRCQKFSESFLDGELFILMAFDEFYVEDNLGIFFILYIFYWILLTISKIKIFWLVVLIPKPEIPKNY